MTTTTNAKHTPGPWRLEGPFDERRIEYDYTDASGNRHSGNVGIVDGKRGEANEANARLIAEAPAMADALRGLLEAYDHPLGELLPSDVAKARAILARIDGEKE
jgi:hypothetical protein